MNSKSGTACRTKRVRVYVEVYDESSGEWVFMDNPALRVAEDGTPVFDVAVWEAFKKEQRRERARLRARGIYPPLSVGR